jgi:hypothetical protein
VLREVEQSAAGMRRFLCRCDCGIEREVRIGAMRNGQSRSCGRHQKGIARGPLVEGPGHLFGEVLRELLESHGMSAIELARHVGRTPSHVSNYVYGLANPSPVSIEDIVDGLEASEREAYRLHLAAARDRGYRI